MNKNRNDAVFLSQAISLAGQVSPRRVSPNPRAGCVLVKNGRIISAAAHQRLGGPHAEALALKKTGPRARGCTAYVSLEPCMPFKSKKTPSCAHALVAAGVRRVVFPVVDPNPHVAGRGANFLRRSGVQVTCDKSAASQSIALNRGFFSRMQRHRPWVILKTALSLDGKAATATGQSRWITGQAARAAVHRMRAECDAILVGAGTILSDNPALTSHGNGPNPLRVIFAGRRKLPSNSRVFDAAAETVVYTIKKEKDMLAALRDLSQAGVGTLLVEGGPTLHSVLLRAGLVDEARVFIAPKFISGTDNPNRAPTIDSPNVSRLGSDWLIEGTL